jgi:hypothetical protein
MDSSGRITLRQAADLIRQGKRSQAQPLLVEFLRDEPNNAQAWYLLSHALTEPGRQQYAILQALRADPTFERARNRLITLQGGTPPAKTTPPPPKFDPVPQSPPKPAPAPVTKPEPVIQKPAGPKPGAAFFDNEEARSEATQELRTESTFEESGPPKPRRSFRGLLIGLIVFGLLATAIYFGRDLLAGSITLTNPTATPVALRTLPPTWTSTSTTEPPTLTSTPVATSTPAPSETPGPTQAITLQ